jgi:hypothetical protein
LEVDLVKGPSNGMMSKIFGMRRKKGNVAVSNVKPASTAISKTSKAGSIFKSGGKLNINKDM